MGPQNKVIILGIHPNNISTKKPKSIIHQVLHQRIPNPLQRKNSLYRQIVQDNGTVSNVGGGVLDLIESGAIVRVHSGSVNVRS